MKKLDVILCGVGGQGILLSGKILGQLALSAGLDTKVSEEHGMSQRGGSVISHARIAPEVFAPLIPTGCADAMIALEPLEAARYLPFLKPGGLIAVSTRQIPPAGVLTGDIEYPDGFWQNLENRGTVLKVDAQKIADDCQTPRSANIALLGAFAAHTDFEKAAWLDAVSRCVPLKTVESNCRAFEAGWKTQKED